MLVLARSLPNNDLKQDSTSVSTPLSLNVMFRAFWPDYLVNVLCFLITLLVVLGNGDLYLNINDSLSSTLQDALEMVRKSCLQCVLTGRMSCCRRADFSDCVRDRHRA